MDELLVSYRWHRLKDLPSDWSPLSRPDIDDSREAWVLEKQSLHDEGAKLDRLYERLATRWAIETGLIERVYTMDRGITETLVDLGLQALDKFQQTGRVSANAAKIIEDQRAALNFVFTYLKEERPISNSYLKELHQLLLRSQDYVDAVDQFGHKFRTEVLKGCWKTQPNNPVTTDGTIHEYCPPEFVQDEIDSLLAMHVQHIDAGVRPEVEAAWLHHAFTQIHPFQDGNGRVARALATLVFLRHGFLPLVIRDEHRETYIDALEAADAEDLRPLVSFFANVQSSDIEEAITFVRTTTLTAGIHDIALAAAAAASRHMRVDEERLESVTFELRSVTRDRLLEASRELRLAFSEASVPIDVEVFDSRDDNEHWWNQQIISAAKDYKFRADLTRYRPWVQMRLTVRATARWAIVVSFHHKVVRTEVMAVVMFLTSSEAGRDEARPTILGTRSEFTYTTEQVDQPGFTTWLDEGLARLLSLWQSQV